MERPSKHVPPKEARSDKKKAGSTQQAIMAKSVPEVEENKVPVVDSGYGYLRRWFKPPVQESQGRNPPKSSSGYGQMHQAKKQPDANMSHAHSLHPLNVSASNDQST